MDELKKIARKIAEFILDTYFKDSSSKEATKQVINESIKDSFDMFERTGDFIEKINKYSKDEAAVRKHEINYF